MRYRNLFRGLERIGQVEALLAEAADDGEMLPAGVVAGDVQVVELVRVVVADESRRLLQRVGLELHLRRRGETECLLAPRDQRLAEPGTEGFGAVQAQPAGTRPQ